MIDQWVRLPEGPLDADSIGRTTGLLSLWFRRADDFFLFSFQLVEELFPIYDITGACSRDTFFDQAMRKRDLFARNFVTPVAAPVDRRDEQIARSLKLPHATRDSRGGCF